MESNYWSRRTLTRRAALRAAGVGVIGLGAATLVGCGGGSDGGGGSTGGSSGDQVIGAAKFKRGGTIRMGTPALSGGLDPHFSGSGYHKTRLAFDSLLDFDE